MDFSGSTSYSSTRHSTNLSQPTKSAPINLLDPRAHQTKPTMKDRCINVRIGDDEEFRQVLYDSTSDSFDDLQRSIRIIKHRHGGKSNFEGQTRGENTGGCTEKEVVLQGCINRGLRPRLHLCNSTDDQCTQGCFPQV